MDVSASPHAAFVYGNPPPAKAVYRFSPASVGAPVLDKVVGDGRIVKPGAGSTTPPGRPETVEALQAVNDDKPYKSPSPFMREIEVDATELQPLVIPYELPKATRAFLEVAAERTNFQIIDIYV